jgi:hypothetical protein
MDMARGARWRERREWERTAWLAATIISPHVKRPPSIRRMTSFLGPDEEAIEQAKLTAKARGPVDKSPEGIRAFIDEIARKQKPHVWTMLSDKYAPPEGNEEK